MIKPCLITLMLLSVSELSFAYVDVERLADCIRVAEGNPNYGVLTKYKHTTPRQACINSIKSAIKRANSDDPAKVIPEMGRVYAPTSNCANDPHHLNKNWSRNVLALYLSS